jgi:hypothetical protein
MIIRNVANLHIYMYKRINKIIIIYVFIHSDILYDDIDIDGFLYNKVYNIL